MDSLYIKRFLIKNIQPITGLRIFLHSIISKQKNCINFTELQNGAGRTGHFCDFLWLAPLLHLRDNLHNFVEVRELHGGELGMDEGVVDGDFEGSSPADSAGDVRKMTSSSCTIL
jgi:hypothetical protein